jgi:hypothetical protein
MMPGMEEVGPAVGMMDDADRMPMVRMRVPVQSPAPLNVAVVRSPEDADAGDDRHQDPGIEDTGVEPVAGAAGVQPLPGKETGKYEHQATRPVVGWNVVTTPNDLLAPPPLRR